MQRWTDWNYQIAIVGMISADSRRQLSSIGVLLIAMWLVLFVDATIPLSLADYGLKPRRLSGLPGIFTMPFLHGSIGHLLSNSISLGILLALLVGSTKRPWPVVAAIAVTGGVLLWVFGRNANHIGASGLVFGLIGYLILNGFLSRKLVPALTALVVGALFGGSLLWNIMPGGQPDVSWDGHLLGLLGGAAVAYFTSTNSSK